MRSSPSNLSSRLALLVAACLPLASATAAFPQLKLEVVCQNQLYAPVTMVSPLDGSGRMMVGEQRGRIRIFRNGMLEPTPFLDLGAKLCTERAGYDERGLLGMAFHPGFSTSVSPGFRKFYIFYIANSPLAPGVTADPVDSREVISEFQVSATNPDVADLASERVLLTWDKPQFNHAGGGLEFGPDGYLYFTVGDGGSSQDNFAGHTGGSTTRPAGAMGNAQDLTKLFGKMHRIDPLGTNGPGGQYGIPADNPFAAGAGGARREIYAYGLRNTWRFSFDSRTGGTNRLIAADVGQGEVEEIDIITKGANFGWRNREGSFVPTFSTGAPAIVGTVTDPIAQYAHPGVIKGSPALPQYGVSVAGGYIYRGSAIPALVGKYVFGDYSVSTTAPNGPMLGLEETSPGVWAMSQLDILGSNPIGKYIYAFGQDQAGELYVLTNQIRAVTGVDPTTGFPSGAILKIVPVPTTTAVTLTATKDNTIFGGDLEQSLSNGAGDWFFAGSTDPSKNSGAVRRALVSWNLTSVPVGSTVATAAVTLKMDRTISPAYSFSLHKLNTAWGEGTANAAVQEGDGIAASATDATWLKPIFGQIPLWTNPGGDYVLTPSASLSVAAETNYTWSAPGLAKDATGWVNASTTNFGWLLKADQESVTTTGSGTAGQFTVTVADSIDLRDGMVVAGTGIGTAAKIATGGINTTTQVLTLTVANASAVSGSLIFAAPSAKRFAARTATLATARPKLALTYVPPPAAVTNHRKLWELAGYFTGQYINDNYDTDGDGITDGLEYAWGFLPRSSNLQSAGFSVNQAALATGGPVVITFRRDPLATDLTYRCQVSTDLQTWTTLTTSTAGGVPTGSGYVSEVVTDTPFRNVTVNDTVPLGSTRRLYRLQVLR